MTGAGEPAGTRPFPSGARRRRDPGYSRPVRSAGRGAEPGGPRGRTRSSRECAGELTGPFALKAVGLLHKSDAGGVRLGLADADAVAAAFRELHARLGDLPYAVEELAELRDGVELIVGVKRDPRFGPVAMVGFGGVHTEVLGDVASAGPLSANAPRPAARLRRAPLRRVYRAAAGRRGRSGAVIAAVTRSAPRTPRSLDRVQPLLVRPAGVLALDRAAVGPLGPGCPGKLSSCP